MCVFLTTPFNGQMFLAISTTFNSLLLGLIIINIAVVLETLRGYCHYNNISICIVAFIIKYKYLFNKTC